ncbi:MAG: hypothetical protein AAGB04_32740, partial [Pseudomonadota bacterium]
VGTSVGTIKSALSRSRRKMTATTLSILVDEENRQLARQFSDAINRQDLEGVKRLMADSMSIVVCNVGGGRGKSEVWTEKSLRLVSARSAELEGEAFVILFDNTEAAIDVVRVEASGGRITRVTDYCYAPETLTYVAQKLGLEITTRGYHQPERTLVEMISSTTLPWRAE